LGNTGWWPVVRGSLPRTCCVASQLFALSLNSASDRMPHAGSMRSLERNAVASKRKTETEMERAEIFEFVGIRIHAVVETNRTNRQLVTQTGTNRIAHIVQPNVLGGGQQIASVSKHGALQFAENWERVFNIEDGKKFAADWMTMIIMRAEITLAEAAYRRRTAVKKTFVDGNLRRFIRAAVGKRMDDATTGTERD